MRRMQRNEGKLKVIYGDLFALCGGQFFVT